MEDEYDVVVLGTGLKECILSGLMSVGGKKVLHIDRNSFYGGESASLNLEQLYEKFRDGQKPPAELGRTRDYCVDLIPKLIMACGNLVKMLLYTKVTRYLEFKSVAGSYVFHKDLKLHKVPASTGEATSSKLMGLFEKYRFKNLLVFCSQWDPEDIKTHEGMDINKVSTKTLFEKYSLDEATVQFAGHAMALHLDDSYLEKPARETVERIKLYTFSVQRYGNSPYIYPVWGLGGLPESFSRLCAVHGGVYMLNKPIKSIEFDENGKVNGVTDLEGKTAKCKQIICDPSYVLESHPNKVKKTGQIVRCICILSHPVDDTNGADSTQIIIPFHRLKNKRSDIYMCVVSYHHKVCANNKYVAVISTKKETNDEKSELEPALKLLGKIDEQFIWTSDYYEPTDDGTKDQLFVTSSYDATTHFESATEEVIRMYAEITGKPLDLSASIEEEKDENAE